MTDLARARLGAVGFLLFIVVPLVFYLKRRGQTDRRMVLSIFGIWIIWNLVHGPIHEISHLLGGWLVGQHVKDYRLIQHFWEGDFVRGYISWENGRQAQYMVSTPAPYVIDLLMVLLGYSLFRWRSRFPALLGALVLLLTFLRPIYDIATNYAADTIFGGVGDVGFLLNAYPPVVVHVFAWLVMLLAAAGATREILKTHKQNPTTAVGTAGGAAVS